MTLSLVEPVVFTSVVERYGHGIYNFALRYSGDPRGAQDVVQETLIEAFDARSHREQAGSVVTWLFGIARHVMQRRERRTGHAVVVSLEPRLGLERRGQKLRDGDSCPRGAVRRLPPAQREVLLLVRYHAMSYQQIAEIVGSSVDAVEYNVSRAMLTLMTCHADPREDADERAL